MLNNYVVSILRSEGEAIRPNVTKNSRFQPKKVKSVTCYSASYMRLTRGQKRFDNLGSSS